VRLPIIGALHTPVGGKKYVEGLFHLGGMQLYVNRGIGTVGLPFRLNCPPEITVITLQPA
jgi:predicted MPP superfamily phosphohydrolase